MTFKKLIVELTSSARDHKNCVLSDRYAEAVKVIDSTIAVSS